MGRKVTMIDLSWQSRMRVQDRREQRALGAILAASAVLSFLIGWGLVELAFRLARMAGVAS